MTRYKLLRNVRITSAPPIKVPNEPPMLVRMMTNRTLVNLLRQKPLMEKTSSDNVSKSATLGRLI